MSIIRSCMDCTTSGAICEFPTNSVQCYRCRALVQRCDGPWSVEEHQRVESEIQRLGEEMDTKIARVIDRPELFERLKEQLTSLQNHELSSTDNLDDSAREGTKSERMQRKRKLLKLLAQIRQQSLPQDSAYQALRDQHTELERLEEEIMRSSFRWLDEIAEMTAWPNYRGLPMPDSLDQDQWKASVAWAEAYPDSHRDYPDPSSFNIESEDNDDEPDDEIEHQIIGKISAILMEFYPVFDTLVKHKASVVAFRDRDKHTKSGPSLPNASQIKSDLAAIELSAAMMRAHLAYLEHIVHVVKSGASDEDIRVLQHGSQVCHGLLSLFSTSVSVACSDLISLNGYTKSSKAMDTLRKGIKEVERFLDKLSLNVLLFPVSSLDSLLKSNEGVKTTDHGSEDVVMDML